jgi:two-component system CheB/CheR fusion protein
LNDLKIDDPELTIFLTIINSSIVKFRSLINDMSDIGQIESDMITMEMVNIDEIIDNVEWSLDDKIKLNGAVINRSLDVKQIFFSKKNLRSILYNLISNSIKFKKEVSPIINIHAGREGNDIVLSVQDNGIGIPKEEISKVFSIYGSFMEILKGRGSVYFLLKR